MSKILQLNECNWARLNNTEFAYVTNGTINRISAMGVEELHAPADAFAKYQERYAVLENLVALSRVADETAQIAEVDQQQDALLVYVMKVIRGARNTPLASKKTAGQALYNALKPYSGVHELPQRQQVQKVQGMLSDLAQPKLAAHIQTLGLTSEVEELTALNAQYTVLIDSRAEVQRINTMENAKAVRQELEALYKEITLTIWAFSIAMPSETLTNFILSMNKLLLDTKTAYNLRTAQSGKKEEDATEDGSESEEAEDSTVHDDASQEA